MNKSDLNSPHLARQNIPAGSFIFIEGDNDRHFYIVEIGEIEVFSMSQGEIKPIAKFSSGESFGEFALLADVARSASARAITDCVVVKVSREGFEEMLAQLPPWADIMLRNFAKRLINMNETLKKTPQFISHK